MKIEELERVLKSANAKLVEGKYTMASGATITIYSSRGGASLNVPKIEELRVDGGLLFLRTAKGEIFALASEDVLAVATEAPPAEKAQRRAGFG